MCKLEGYLNLYGIMYKGEYAYIIYDVSIMIQNYTVYTLISFG